MDMVAEVAVEELERIFPDFKFDKKNLAYMRLNGQSSRLKWLTSEKEYKKLSKAKKIRVKEYMNFIISIDKAEKAKRASRSKACPV